MYACKVRASGLLVAIKLVTKQGITTQEYRDILREVECLTLLDHRNIMPISDYHEDDEYVYIISPLAEGMRLCIL